jgi:bifunctional oligoribonuclease and PAP phosphatase NrnA
MNQGEITLKFNQIQNLFLNSRNVLIGTHNNPDGDGVGSMLALNCVLKKRGVVSNLFCQDPPPSELNFLPYWHEIQTSYANQRYDAVIALDYGDFNRTGLVLEPENIHTPLITIDHHPPGRHKGHIRIIEPSFSSTSEIIYYFLQENNISIDRNIATCLLTGIFTDTGGFRHSNISQDVLKIMGELLSLGGDLNKIAQNAQGIKSQKYSKLWGEILNNLNFLEEIGMVFTIVTQDQLHRYNTSKENLDGIANMMCAIPETKFSLFLSEEPNGDFRGSLRSEEFKKVDVSSIANVFGGGGHKLAAGFTTGMSPEEIILRIKQIAR